MKAAANDQIRTLIDVQSDFSSSVIPRGSLGIVVETYNDPEGYAVDLAIPNDILAGGWAYENVVLTPDQFEVTNRWQAVHDEDKFGELSRSIPER